LIPTSKNLVLVRDGRDVALSMMKRGWCDGDLIRCINRWNDFTRLALNAKEKVPKENYLMVRYEDLLQDFQTKTENIINFFNLQITRKIREKLTDKSYKLKPKEMNFGKWKKEFSKEEKTYFSDLCGDLMEKLGYE
ncbi:MAG: sulfotransferase, partial [Candidatus Heimdallarchaeaceae archaeon]